MSSGDRFVGWFPPATLDHEGQGEGDTVSIDDAGLAREHLRKGDALTESRDQWIQAHFAFALVHAILALDATIRRALPYGAGLGLPPAPATPPPAQASAAGADAVQAPNAHRAPQ